MDALWIPDPATIVRAISSGTDDMGDVTSEVSPARFGMDVPWVLAFIRLHFSGGSGVADCDIVLDSAENFRHDVVLETIEKCGTDKDANYAVLPGEFHMWVMQPRDRIVLHWTNPDSPSMVWGMEAGFAPIVNA